jgi:PadR family transcriptional regulator, regulatory protein PadR
LPVAGSIRIAEVKRLDFAAIPGVAGVFGGARLCGIGDCWNRKVLHYFDFFIIIEEMSRQGYLGEFELMVLLALMRLGEDAYGVPIAREIEQRTKREVALGSVYASLERLEEKGLVSSKLGDPTKERGGRAKRYFELTGQGLKEVRNTQRTLVSLWKGLPELEGGTV